jgi:hypothetical protein
VASCQYYREAASVKAFGVVTTAPAELGFTNCHPRVEVVQVGIGLHGEVVVYGVLDAYTTVIRGVVANPVTVPTAIAAAIHPAGCDEVAAHTG